MDQQAEPEITLRDAIESNLDAAEAGTLGSPQETVVEPETGDPIRDDQGRFSKPPEAEPEVVPEPEEELRRPTSWKKDYLPLWDKLATGQPLSAEEAKKVAQYSQQREKEFASGVSTYKAEADNAKTLHEALAPFLPELQANGIHPAAWINNLGRAHQTLAKGSIQERIQMFQKLAQDYQVPLSAFSQQQDGGVDPLVGQLMQQIQSLSGQVNTVASWRDQQEQQQLQGMLSPFSDVEKYPHYEQVRLTMAQLLESGVAQDLDTAYKKAVRLDDDAWKSEQNRTAQASAAQQAVAKAKAKAVSVKSTTPSGQTRTSDAKDRRSMLAESLDAAFEGRV